MWKFITTIWSIWVTIRPVYRDIMATIREVKSTDLSDISARDAVKQRLTDRIQKYALKDIQDSKLNAIIEICYQIYLIEKQ